MHHGTVQSEIQMKQLYLFRLYFGGYCTSVVKDRTV